MGNVIAVFSFLLLGLLPLSTTVLAAGPKEGSLEITWEVVAEDLEHPWSVAFLPSGNMLVTERPGRLRVIRDRKLDPVPVEGLPRIVAYGQGGLMDVVLHPRFEENRILYLSYVADGMGGIGTEVMRARFDGYRLSQQRQIFRATPKSRGGRHFGGRMVFDKEGYLYLTLGDRGNREQAQYLDTHPGSVIRLTDDGAIPTDNPFYTGSTARPAIYTYGHRNPQGMVVHPDTGDIWIHEHGPRGGDEINLLRPGLNYGWPVVTHGRAYSGLPIGEGKEKEGMESPLYAWVPSVAPSGLSFYTGEAFPQWKGNLLIGSLRDEMLIRIVLEGESVAKEEHLFKEKFGRIRDVRQGPDGLIYLLTDHRKGKVIRLKPTEKLTIDNS